MPSAQSRYIFAIKVELSEQGKEGEPPMWELSNIYNGLDYAAVIDLQKMIGSMADQLTAMGEAQAEKIKGKAGK